MENKKRVFIASSNDLEDERQKLKTLLYDQGFIPILWEDIDHSITDEKFQDRINNDHLTTSDIVIFMVKSRLGEYTIEEFKVAYENLGKNIKKMYVYFLNPKTMPKREEADKIYDLKELLYFKEKKLYREVEGYIQLENHFLKQIRYINDTDKIINSLLINKTNLTPLTKDYLKSNMLQGGEKHFQESFTYTLENAHKFIFRQNTENILSRLKPNTSKGIFFLNGKSGYGKTTAIRQIIFNLLDDDSNEIYINNINLDIFIDELEYLEDNNKNTIVIVDNFKFNDNKVTNRLLNLVITRNMFHLILSPLRVPHDEKCSILNKNFIQYMEFAYYKNYEIFDYNDYAKDKNYFLDRYNENFPNGNNLYLLESLLKKNSPMAFICTLIFEDANIEKSIYMLLQKLESKTYSSSIKIVFVLMSIYFFTSKGISVRYQEIYEVDSDLENIIIDLYNAHLITFNNFNIKGVSEFYDELINQVILKNFFSDNKEMMFDVILDTMITLFNRISPLFKYKDNNDIYFHDIYELKILKYIDLIIDKLNIYDLWDLRDLLVQSNKIDNCQKEVLYNKVLLKFYSMRIDGVNSFKKFEMFNHTMLKDFEEFGWQFNHKVLDFSLGRYKYKHSKNNREYMNINKLIEDYEVNNNVVTYLLATIKYYNRLTINDETKEKLTNILKKLYIKLDKLVFIDSILFTKLFAIYCSYSTAYEIDLNFKLDKIFSHILDRDHFHTYSFQTLMSVLSYEKSLIRKSYFNLSKIIDNNLNGDYIIFNWMIQYDYLSEEDIEKIIDHVSSKLKPNYYTIVIQFFYHLNNNQQIDNEKKLLLCRWLFNGILRNISSNIWKIEKEGNVTKNYILNLFFDYQYNESIVDFIIFQNNYSLIQKYIHIQLILDTAIGVKKLEFKKYSQLLTNTEQLYIMLYNEYRNFINTKTIREYIKLSLNKKKYGFRTINIQTEEEYSIYRRRAILLFEFLGKYYLKNINLQYPKNIIANILKVSENMGQPIYRDKIEKLLLSVIKDKNEESYIREKSILDLSNYYNDIGKYNLGIEIIEKSFNEHLLTKDRYIEFAQINLRKMGCPEIKIKKLFNSLYIKPIFQEIISINQKKIGLIIGAKGKNIRYIKENYNTEVVIKTKKGTVILTSSSKDMLDKAVRYVSHKTENKKISQYNTVNFSEYGIKEIAKEVELCIDDVVDFANNCNMPLGVITSESILKKAQALGLMQKIKKEYK